MCKKNLNFNTVFSCYTSRYLNNKSLENSPSLSALTDLELVALYKSNKDKSTLGVLFKRHTKFVFAVSMKYIKDQDKCKDIVMDIFEQLFDKLLKHEISNFKPWLYSVVKNNVEDLIFDLSKHEVSKDYFLELRNVDRTTDYENQCLHEIRNNRHYLKDEWYEKNNGEDVMENNPFLYPDREIVLNEQFIKLEKGITELSEEQKTCIELFYLHDKSYEDISNMTGYDMKKVKSYIQNGKRNLKIFLLRNHE